MPNAINYATKYQNELDQVLVQQALSAELETPQVNWLNAKSFQVPSVSVTGYKPHSRNGGFNRGDVDVTHEVYTLGFDRDIEFFVDQADVDESAQAASAANITRTFTTEHSAPEMDAYRFSKLATKAVAESNTAEAALTKSTVYGALKAAILPLRKYGPANIVVYVSSEVMDLLEQADNFTRQITVQGGGPGVLESRITAIDGVRLVEVWDAARFHTAFDFTEGFVPAIGAKAINFLIVAKPAIIAKAKIASIYLFQPGQHTEGDGYLYQNRLYHDLFVMKNKADGVFVHTKPAA
jgi:hypothetical protein